MRCENVRVDFSISLFLKRVCAAGFCFAGYKSEVWEQGRSLHHWDWRQLKGTMPTNTQASVPLNLVTTDQLNDQVKIRRMNQFVLDGVTIIYQGYFAHITNLRSGEGTHDIWIFSGILSMSRWFWQNVEPAADAAELLTVIIITMQCDYYGRKNHLSWWKK